MKALLIGLALALPLVSCSRPFIPATPPGFVDMGDIYPEREYRATTADGVVLGIRAIDNEPKGELSFWARAIENRMRDTGAYALLGKRSIKNRATMDGLEFRFGHDEGRTPHLYWVAIFVTDKKIFLLEAGGTKVEVEKRASQIEWSFRNLLPK